MLEQILHDEVDGNYDNGEVCPNWDPVNFTESIGVRVYEFYNNCSEVTDFDMDATGNQEIRDLLKNQALPDLVGANESHYGLPSNPEDPTWGTQDPNY